MGKFEKLVVLTVLFVAAIVLAISFNSGGDKVEASDPLSGARELLDQEGAPAPEVVSPGFGAPLAPSAPAPAGETTGKLGGEPPASLLLNAGTDDAPGAGLRPTSSAPATLSLEPESDPTRRILSDDPGLRPSFLDEYMRYTVVEGDTWSSLAQRFYQDGQYTRNLHRANEGMDELVPGTEVLVPVFDFLAESGESAPADEPAILAEPSVARPTPESTFLTKPGSAPVSRSATAGKVDGKLDGKLDAKLPEYEVRPGDTLSDISLAVFGTSTRWKEIFEANGDRLKKPESLQAGMKLRIPAGGKLPAAASAKSAPTKEVPKPKTAQATEKATSPKKKVL